MTRGEVTKRQKFFGDLHKRSKEGKGNEMNWDLIWTTIGLAVASFIILPFYIAMLIAYKKAISKVELEFLATAHHMGKTAKLDDAIERLFEEGETR